MEKKIDTFIYIIHVANIRYTQRHSECTRGDKEYRSKSEIMLYYKIKLKNQTENILVSD